MATRFLGTHRIRVDEKGRLFLPVRYRDELGSGLVITKGQERCLCIYPPAEFDRMSDAISAGAASGTGKDLRDYSRVFFSAASEQVPDKQGRVAVDAELRAYAGLTRDIVVIGINTRLEVWDAAAWDAQLAATEQGFATLETEVVPGL